ncbi:hypothetical protein MKW92_021795 [Papaver armeniacum]|nr:hypothetical protein MKW92_021795 [Papaver armeniacum]
MNYMLPIFYHQFKNFIMAPSSKFSIIFFLILIFHTYVFIAQENNLERYEKCQRNFVCGDSLSVGYPFWGGHYGNGDKSRPEYCGLINYRLDCLDGDVAQIEISGESYRVLEINTQTQVMNITNTAFVGYESYGACPFEYPIPNFHSVDFKLAQDVDQLTLYSDCVKIPDQLPFRFKCLIYGSPTRDAYFWFGMAPGVPPDFSSCNKTVKTPVMLTALRDLTTNPEILSAVIKQGFDVTYFNAESDIGIGLCLRCTSSGGTCGSNTTEKIPTCFCPDGSIRDACVDPPSATSPGVVGAFGAVGILLSIPLMIYFLRKKHSSRDGLEVFFKTHGSLAPKRYSFKDVKKMTNSFKEKLGKGGYGCVFKGKLHDGRLVAVKVLFSNMKTKNAGLEFFNEVASISRTSHVNIVALLGFCFDRRNKRALIYEFMPNGSLEKFIFGEKLATSEEDLVFGWERFYRVAIEIARGLEYLHRGCTTRILHFDIKPHNILLDKDFHAKISDFGLAKLCLEKESIISMSRARGTAGYIAPEVFNKNFGGISSKSDVYSYGMMILEMVGGRKNIDVKVGTDHLSQLYFPHQIYDRIKLNQDLGLHGIMTDEREQAAKKMIIVGLWCIQTNPLSRPSMSKVLEMLEGSLETLEIPPKPFLSSPPRSLQPSTSSSTSASSPLRSLQPSASSSTSSSSPPRSLQPSASSSTSAQSQIHNMEISGII